MNLSQLPPEISVATLDRWLDQDRDAWTTPAYLYDGDVLAQRVGWLAAATDGLLQLSYAIKANPNPAVLRKLAGLVPWLDASSWSEVQRALDAGKPAAKITYSGPGKRPAELAAAVRSQVTVVVESLDEIDDLAALATAAGVVLPVIVRVNPDHVPRGFGASMSGKPSQFGIDEAVSPQAVAAIDSEHSLRLAGLHIYTASNCLSAEPIIENFENMARIFQSLADDGRRPVEKLIFGSGFGIAYHAGQSDLDVAKVINGIWPVLTKLRGCPGLVETDLLLEMGRWLIGPAGALLTRVLTAKTSRGQRIAVCDAGFNNHLAAAGMMGATFRKDYPIVALTSETSTEMVKLTGPLCTSIDAMAGPLELPRLARGDVVAFLKSGAYGLTASPTRFISHPDPTEVMVEGGHFSDVSETRMNHVIPL